MFWIYISDKGQFLPSTLREKAGDCTSALEKQHAYRHSANRAGYRMVRVGLSMIPEREPATNPDYYVACCGTKLIADQREPG